MDNNRQNIAVTGMGCICAIADTAPGLIPALESPVSNEPVRGIFTAYSQQLMADRSIRTGAEQAALEAEAKINNPFFAVPHSTLFAERLHTGRDPMHLALAATQEAMCMAGLSCNNPPVRLGVAMGTTVGASLNFLHAYSAAQQNIAQTTQAKAEVEDYRTSNPALSLGQMFKASGPLLTITNACTSGADAIGLACRWLRLGLCDYVLAGGTDSLSYVSYVGFSRLMLYDHQTCKPFSTARAGLNLGEGAAVLLLEREDNAHKRGAEIAGFISGYANFNDGHHLTCPHPEGRGLQNAINSAMREGDVTEKDLSFVNVHGTGTLENDKVENLVMDALLPEIPLWAVKGRTGHTLGASGALEAVISLQALLGGKVPAYIDYSAEEKLSPRLITRSLPIEKEYALSTSIGFAGSNSALLVRKARKK